MIATKSSPDVRTMLLGDIVDFLDHLRRPVTESDRRPGPYPYYGANGIQGYVDEYIFNEPLLLLAEDGGYFDSPERGIAYRISGKTWVNNHAHVLRPRSQVDLAYLCRILENFDVSSFISGTTRAKLTKARASQIPIPLPPIGEQRRIAAILDQADDLRRKRRLALEKLNILVKSLFADICAPGGSTRQVSFADVAYFQEGPGVRNWQFRNTGIKLINVKNIVDGTLDITNTERYLDPLEIRDKYAHFLLDTGDLVLASSGVTWGKVAEVDKTHLPLCLNTSMIRVRPINSVRKSFIRAFIENGTFRPQIERLITGSAQPNFGPSHLRQVVVSLPSAEAQERFDKSAEHVFRLRGRFREQERALDQLFASLQHHAFAGTLKLDSAQETLALLQRANTATPLAV